MAQKTGLADRFDECRIKLQRAPSQTAVLRVYTGHHGVTDVTGAFCIDGVPAGTYDLSVQVNDYRLAWVTGIVVSDVPSDVVVDAVLPPVWLWPPWPNPAQGKINIRLKSKAAEPFTVAVHDVAGRLVRGWQTTGDGGEQTLAWDGRDRTGRNVPSGCYFVILRSKDVSLTRWVQVLR